MSVLLPSGYTQIEYIESSGTQYIDIGFIPNQDTRIIVDAQQTTAKQYPRVFASGGVFSSGSVSVDYEEGSVYVKWGSTGMIKTSASSDNNRNIFDLNKNVLYINEVQIESTTYTSYQSSGNLYLFAYSGAQSSEIFAGKLFSTQIYDDGTLIRDMYPCYRESDSTVGMYDIVNNQFYGNSGSGVFIAGPNVLPPKMYFGGTEINDIYYNGNIVNDVYFNGALVKEGNYVPPLSVFTDDFESYTVGAFPSSVYSIVYNGTGDANQKVISTTQRDGTTGNVLQLQGANNWSAQIRHAQTFDANYRYIVFEVDIKFVNTGAFSLGSSQASGQWSKCVCGVSYNASTGNLWAVYNDTGTDLGIAYTSDTWTHFKIVLDRDDSKQYIYRDNVLLNPNGDTASSVIPEWVTLEAGNSGTNTGYYDNLNVYETNNINL